MTSFDTRVARALRQLRVLEKVVIAWLSLTSSALHSRPPAFSEKAAHLTKGVSRCRFDRFSSFLFFSFFFSFGAGGEGGRRKGTYLSGHRSGRNDSENDLKVAAMAFGPGIAHIDDLVNRCLWKQCPVVKDVTHNYVNVLDENGTLTLMAPMSQYCTFIYQASCRCHIYVPKSEEYFVRIDNEIGNERSTTLKSL